MQFFSVLEIKPFPGILKYRAVNLFIYYLSKKCGSFLSDLPVWFSAEMQDESQRFLCRFFAFSANTCRFILDMTRIATCVISEQIFDHLSS
jgi:hypothetical protein